MMQAWQLLSDLFGLQPPCLRSQYSRHRGSHLRAPGGCRSGRVHQGEPLPVWSPQVSGGDKYIYQSSPLLPERSAPLPPALPWELLMPRQGQNWKASGPGSIHPHEDIFKRPEPTYTHTRPAKRPALGDREPSAPQLGNKQETGMVIISRQKVGASCPATPGEGAPPQTYCPRGDGKAERTLQICGRLYCPSRKDRASTPPARPWAGGDSSRPPPTVAHSQGAWVAEVDSPKCLGWTESAAPLPTA